MPTDRYPEITVVGCILLRTSSFARLRSSEASSTTDVVPSPTSLSCCEASDTKIRACFLSRDLRCIGRGTDSWVRHFKQGQDSSSIVRNSDISHIVDKHFVQSAHKSAGHVDSEKAGLTQQAQETTSRYLTQFGMQLLYQISVAGHLYQRVSHHFDLVPQHRSLASLPGKGPRFRLSMSHVICQDPTYRPGVSLIHRGCHDVVNVRCLMRT